MDQQDKDKKLTAYEKWELPVLSSGPEVEGKPSWHEVARKKTKEPALKLPTAEEIESIRKAAYEEGFSKGKEEGYATGLAQGETAGKKKIDAEVAKLGQIIKALMEPIEPQQQEIESALLVLIEKVCQIILRRELSINSDCVRELLVEALAFLKTGSANMKIYLNQQDHQLISEYLQSLPDYHDGWQLVPHRNLSPGGCIIERGDSTVDATIDTRFKAVTKQLYDRELNQMKDMIETDTTIPTSSFNDDDEDESG